MKSSAHPYRSVLYIPASNRRALEKAAGLQVDAIIFDLEDAVAPDQKDTARALLADALKNHDYGKRRKIVRINGSETAWAADDLATFAALAPDAILIPKVETAQGISEIARKLCGDTRIWAMMETPRGILGAATIAQVPELEGFVMGTNDLAKDLGSTGRAALGASLQMCLLAARANGLVCVDGVYNKFKDEDGLRAECQAGRDMGFDGKTLIHPAQITSANEIFGPSQEQLDLARRHISAYEAAAAQGQGVAVVDGQIVENLHVASARQILAMAEFIDCQHI